MRKSQSVIAQPDKQSKQANQTVRFVHQSESEFARILDFYQVAWEYEPQTFPLRWNESGDAIECLSPDFYLPAYGVYIELTTMKPRLMAKKRRKIRLFQEIYPHLQIRLIQSKDFHQLMWKYVRQ